MKNFTKLVFYLFFSFTSLIYGLEIDVTKGQVEPLPMAVVSFNTENIEAEEYSSKINAVIANNLNNTGLFKILSEKSFLQSKNEVFLQPNFGDWRLIDANFLVTGKLNINSGNLNINFKLWDV